MSADGRGADAVIGDPVPALAVVVALGVTGQVASERLRIPSIIVLLAIGLTIGPWLGWIAPDALYGDLLFPGVSAAVGLLLFEGGLSLRWRDLDGIRVVLLRLLTTGVLVAGAVGAVTAWAAGGLPTGPALLFGAIMVVTGPTVVVALLRQARLRPDVARLLRWEGIFVDPIGAVLAVVVFEVLLSEDDGVRYALGTIATTIFVGVAIGAVVGMLLAQLLHRRLVPEHLANAVTFASVLACLAAANAVFHEAGLVATTVLGVVLATQRRAPISGIAEFHESIAVLLVPVMFILLSARVSGEELSRNVFPAAAVLALLILVSRPLSVWASTVGSTVPTRVRLYVAAMAPRGIVAASVSALFGLRLEEEGVNGGGDLAALTFLVVAGTVIVYGAAAVPLARRLRVDAADPGGVVLVGAPPWAAALGGLLADRSIPVLVVAGEEDDRVQASERGLLVYSGRLQGTELDEAVDAVGGRLALVVSQREEVAAFAADRLGRLLGRANVYVVPADEEEKLARAARPNEHWGELAFDGRLTLEGAAERWGAGWSCYVTMREEEPVAVPLIALSERGIPSIIQNGGTGGRHACIVFGPQRPPAAAARRVFRRRRAVETTPPS